MKAVKETKQKVKQDDNGKFTDSSHVIQSSEKLYRCDFCSRPFKSSSGCRRHKLLHTGEKRLKCDICSERFYSRYQLDKHKTEDHQQECPYKCPTCDKCFYRASHLNDHVLTHSTEKAFKCDFCEKRFFSRRSKNRHEKSHGDAQFSCSHCEKGFYEFGELTKHQKNYHSASGTPFVCNIDGCGKKLISLQSLNYHKTSHHRVGNTSLRKRKYTCHICHQVFHVYKLLSQHMDDAHQGVRPFKCSLCSKGFIYLSKLKIHEHEQHNGNNYQCTECDKVYLSESGFRRHLKYHSVGRPFTCENCGKGFTERGEMMKHQRRVHITTEALFQCSIENCGRSFKEKPTLLRHMATFDHDRARTISCSQCDKVFTNVNERRKHRRHAHSNVSPKSISVWSRCDDCGKKFIRDQFLEIHKRTHQESQMPCFYCGASYMNSLMLKIHISAHETPDDDKDVSYTCHYCSHVTTSVHSMRTHMNIHAGKKQHFCEVCDEEFSSPEALVRHGATHPGSETYSKKKSQQLSQKSKENDKETKILTENSIHKHDDESQPINEQELVVNKYLGKELKGDIVQQTAPSFSNVDSISNHINSLQSSNASVIVSEPSTLHTIDHIDDIRHAVQNCHNVDIKIEDQLRTDISLSDTFPGSNNTDTISDFAFISSRNIFPQQTTVDNNLSTHSTSTIPPPLFHANHSTASLNTNHSPSLPLQMTPSHPQPFQANHSTAIVPSSSFDFTLSPPPQLRSSLHERVKSMSTDNSVYGMPSNRTMASYQQHDSVKTFTNIGSANPSQLQQEQQQVADYLRFEVLGFSALNK